MNREELEHCLRAVADVTDKRELYLAGSNSVLAHFPEDVIPAVCLEEAEVDVATVEDTEENSYVISSTFWEGSDFVEMYGIEIDGIQLDEIALPNGWQDRLKLIEITPPYDDSLISVYALDIYDVAASKTVAHREKDRRWLKALFDANLVSMGEVADRLNEMDLDFEHFMSLRKSLQAIVDGSDVTWV